MGNARGTTVTAATDNADDRAARLLTKKAAAAYVGVTTPTFAKWVLAGVLPPSASITRKWDRKAIDAALDKISGLERDPKDDGYELRKKERNARKAARAR